MSAAVAIPYDDQDLIDLATILDDLHEKWTPHEGQVPVGHALFYEMVRQIFIAAGRSWGKTEVIAYIVTRWALCFPGSENYIFEPFQKQAKEILWASNRIQNFPPAKYVEGTNDTEMRITFTNGSFIKLDGSDNYAAYAGIKPKGVSILDEFKDHNPKFFEVYEPNLAAYGAPLILIGSMPDVECQFTETMELFKRSPKKRFFTGRSMDNPHNNREWLEDKKADLFATGNEDIWYREYEALFVKGGKAHLVPQVFKLERKPRDYWLEPIKNDLKNWILYITFDPATHSVFGVSFDLFNPYSKKILNLDEIYETNIELMTTRQIHKSTKEKQQFFADLGVAKFEYVYDEAAAWFRNELSDPELKCDWWLIPTKKASMSRKEGLSLLRDVMRDGLIEIADECTKTWWELENYKKDKHGRIPKINDHCIDCRLYMLQAAGFEFKEEDVPKAIDPDDMPRGHRPEDDFDDGMEFNEI